MRRLSSLGFRSFRRGIGRFVLTAAGVTLGVGVLFGVLVANASASHAFRVSLRGLDRPVVMVRGFGAGDVPIDALERAAKLPGVAVAYGSSGTLVQLDKKDDKGRPRSVWVYGGKQYRGTAPLPRAHPEDRLKFDGTEPRPGADEVSIGEKLASELKVERGDSFVAHAPAGPRTLQVTMIVRRANGEPYEDQNVRTTFETAAALTGRGEAFSNASLTLGPDAEVSDFIGRNAATIGAEVRLIDPQAGQADIRRLARMSERGFAAGAGLSVFVGGFLIFLTFSMQVTERTGTYGTLRALGATRRQVRRVLLAEALVLGVVATALGLLVGLVAAGGITRIVAGAYQIPVPRLRVTPAAVIGAIVAGLGVTTLAALAPAARAARAQPMSAIRGEVGSDTRPARGWIVGIALLVAGVGASRFLRIGDFDPGTLMIVGGGALLAPILVRPTAAVVGRFTRRASAGLGDVSVMHLVRERSKSGYTLSLVTIVLGMVFTLGTMNHTFRTAMNRSLNERLGADLFLNGSVLSKFDDAALDAIESTPGVAHATPLEYVETSIVASPPIAAFAEVIEPKTHFEVLGLPWTKGDNEHAARALARTTRPGVLVQRTQAKQLRLGIGDELRLGTPSGERSFVVAGIFDNRDSVARVVIGTPVAKDAFKLGEPDTVAVDGAEGISGAQLEKSLRKTFADRPNIAYTQVADIRTNAVKQFNRYFAVFLIVLLVALVVGLLGLANTLALSVYRRTRELGVLRAIGARRRSVGAMVVVESTTLALGAVLLAIPLGAIASATILRSTTATTGVATELVYPWWMVPAVAVVALVLGAGAALAPARRASRVDPVAALRFD